MLFNQGAGVFGGATLYPVGGSLFRARQGDFDLDGDMDLVTADVESHAAVVFLNGGDGRLSIAYQGEVGLDSRFHEVVDLNDDGDVDIVLASQEDDLLSIVFNAFGTAPVFVPDGTLVDGVSFGVVESIFEDDFENASTCRWALTAGAGGCP